MDSGHGVIDMREIHLTASFVRSTLNFLKFKFRGHGVSGSLFVPKHLTTPKVVCIHITGEEKKDENGEGSVQEE